VTVEKGLSLLLLILDCAVLLVVTLGMFLLLYTGLLGVWQATFRTDWHALYNLNVFFARKFNEFKLIMNVVFCHPPGSDFVFRAVVLPPVLWIRIWIGFGSRRENDSHK
jgi:ankyrin repeat-rich membrane spanning protein